MWSLVYCTLLFCVVRVLDDGRVTFVIACLEAVNVKRNFVMLGSFCNYFLMWLLLFCTPVMSRDA